MVAAISDNVGGHRAKYDHLARHLPASEVGREFVGGGDPVAVGYTELETIRLFCSLSDIAVVDIGCGIGRLGQHLVREPIKSYLGLDIIPEILAQAQSTAAGDPRFRFAISEECRIPEPDESVDLVVGFSILTHLMDEEVFEYIQETSRVLRPGSLAIFSFFDLGLPAHQDVFFGFAQQHRLGHGDVLKFTTKDVLSLFAKRAGFRTTQFVDGTADMQHSGTPSALLDVESLPATFQFGQSICVLQK